MTVRDALLVLADGTTFEGEAIGADAVATGEVVFNTVLSGYQEVITDPSYAGQIITFTYPHIGNYGVNQADFEAKRPFCRGVVVRDLARRRSSWRSEADLDAQLRAYGIPGIAGIDTRKLTRRIRAVGAIPGAFGPADAVDEAALLAAAQAEPGTDGDRPRRAGDHRRCPTASPTVSARSWWPTTSASSARSCATSPRGSTSRWCRRPRPRPTSSPASPPACSCPTDPATRRPCRTPATPSRGLLGNVPIFGICLGHQLLGRALGAEHGEAARSATTAATTRSATSPPDGSRSRARTTTSPSTPTPSAGEPR